MVEESFDWWLPPPSKTRLSQKFAITYLGYGGGGEVWDPKKYIIVISIMTSNGKSANG